LVTLTVLAIHGAGEPRLRNGKVYWEPLLQQSLGSGYVVRAPRMPEPNSPRYQPWAKRIEELIIDCARPAVVGHSFGASVLLKYFSEATTPPPVAGLFLVATPFWGPKFPDFALRSDFPARLRELAPLCFYHSRDDPEIPIEHLERYRQALPHAVVRVLEGRGHEFDQPQFLELAADIRSLAV
jgi:predicted alpha/beta hydrolase family esterase